MHIGTSNSNIEQLHFNPDSLWDLFRVALLCVFVYISLLIVLGYLRTWLQQYGAESSEGDRGDTATTPDRGGTAVGREGEGTPGRNQCYNCW